MLATRRIAPVLACLLRSLAIDVKGLCGQSHVAGRLPATKTAAKRVNVFLLKSDAASFLLHQTVLLFFQAGLVDQKSRARPNQSFFPSAFSVIGVPDYGCVLSFSREGGCP